MTCKHKFLNHKEHLDGEFSLMPSWPITTLIIGTFNPEDIWAPGNNAQYFYDRSAYFWKLLTKFACIREIQPGDTDSQFHFLKTQKIGLTDLLVSINDADINNQTHKNRIASYKDKELEKFNSFTWNTRSIIRLIKTNKIKAVYFTKLGQAKARHPGEDTFEYQMRQIENECTIQGGAAYRLHTPSGQGLGAGSPRENKLTAKWFHENGGNKFPFLSADFDISKYRFEINRQ